MARQRGPKEIVYDEQLADLMAKVIDICRREGISVHASFDLDHGNGARGVECTTHIVHSDANPNWAAWYEPIMRSAERRHITGGPTDGFIVPRGAAGRQPS